MDFADAQDVGACTFLECGAEDAVGHGLEVGLGVGLVQECEVDVACGVWREIWGEREFCGRLAAPVKCAEGREGADEDGEVDYWDEEGEERGESGHRDAECHIERELVVCGCLWFLVTILLLELVVTAVVMRCWRIVEFMLLILQKRTTM